MSTRGEKGGGTFEGIKLLLCENPLPPLDEAIEAARVELAHSNYYTEPFSAPLRRMLAQQHDVPERLVHINAGSELILRQIFQRLGQRAHLLTPTYALFPEIAERFTETRLLPEDGFHFDLGRLEVPEDTSLVVIVNPNNPNGGSFDMEPLRALLRRHPRTFFMVDEAFIGLAGQPVASWVPRYDNLIVTRTFSKAHSLAGFRVGYAVLPERLADDLNAHNDAYPLTRPSQAAALVLGNISEELAAAEGINVKRYDLLYLFLIAVIVALGVKMVGGLLTAALVAIPPAAARNIGRNLSQYIWSATAIGITSAIGGIVLCHFTGIPAGPLIILVSAGIFLLTLPIAR